MAQYENIIENVTYTDTLRLVGSEWDNTLIRNVVIENVNGNGALLRDVDNVTFDNVTIVNVDGDGIKLSTQGSTSNVVISNSDISRIGEDGINAGQRYRDGVDHPGLKILDNTIDQTGMNGGNDGLRHGIYVQSRDFLIEGNRVSDSEDGNGISVRSSGIVRDNYVEDSNDSGIAYFADHMGRNGTLRIEDNTVVDSGYTNGRSDIDLLSVPNKSYLVDAVSVRSNDLDKGAAGVRVGNGYQNVDVSVSGNGGSTSSYSSGGNEGSDPMPSASGDAGSDAIFGDDGRNVITGTSDDDSIFGLAGADVFVVEKDGGIDTVEDFAAGIDHILIRDFDGVDAAGDLVPRASERNGDTMIDLGDGDGLVLADTKVSDLSSGDFLFY